LKFLPFFLFFFLFLPKAEVVFALAPDAGDHGLEGRCEVTLDRKAAVWRRAPLEVLVIVNIALVHDALESEKSHRVRLEQERKRRKKKEEKKRVMSLLPLAHLILDKLSDLVVIEAELTLARHALNSAVVFLDHLVCDVVLVTIEAIPMPAGERICLHLGFRQAANVACELLFNSDTLLALRKKEKNERKKATKKKKRKKEYPMSKVTPAFARTPSGSSIYLSMSLSCFHLYCLSRMAAAGVGRPKTP